MDIALLSALPFALDRTTLVWVAVGVTLALLVVYTLILLYHWSRYAQGRSALRIALTIYLSVSGGLAALLVGSALALTT